MIEVRDPTRDDGVAEPCSGEDSPPEHAEATRVGRVGVARCFVVATGAVVLVWVLVFSRSDLATSVSTLGQLNLMWLVPLLATQFASMGPPALVQHRLLLSRGVYIPRRSLLGIVYASNALSVTLPLAGPRSRPCTPSAGYGVGEQWPRWQPGSCWSPG